MIADRAPLDAAVAATVVPAIREATTEEVITDDGARWRTASPPGTSARSTERAAIIRRAGDLLDARLAEFCGLLVKEAHKTLGDCVAEVREAVDFCRYYADQAQIRLQDQVLPGPTGESNELRMNGRGVFVCISPWNFPLAIFAGQVVAALVAGNTVAAKPAEQTPAVAARMVDLLHEAGVPEGRAGAAARPGRDDRRRRSPPTCTARASASPARRRSPRSSSARWRTRTARSCRSSPRPAASTR